MDPTHDLFMYQRTYKNGTSISCAAIPVDTTQIEAILEEYDEVPLSCSFYLQEKDGARLAGMISKLLRGEHTSLHPESLAFDVFCNCLFSLHVRGENRDEMQVFLQELQTKR